MSYPEKAGDKFIHDKQLFTVQGFMTSDIVIHPTLSDAIEHSERNSINPASISVYNVEFNGQTRLDVSEFINMDDYYEIPVNMSYSELESMPPIPCWSFYFNGKESCDYTESELPLFIQHHIRYGSEKYVNGCLINKTKIYFGIKKGTSLTSNIEWDNIAYFTPQTITIKSPKDIPLPQGTRVQYNIGVAENETLQGNATIVGIASKSQPIIGITYIIKMDNPIRNDVYFYDCIVANETMIQVMKNGHGEVIVLDDCQLTLSNGKGTYHYK